MRDTRIAVISYHTCPLSDEAGTETGGMNVYVLELSRALARKGYSIDIFTRAVSPQSQRIVHVLPNLRVIHLAAGEEKSVDKRELWQILPEFCTNLLSFIQEEHRQYNLISCHYYYSGIVGLALRDRLHIPMTITFHTLALMKNLVARDEAEMEKSKRIVAEMNLVKKADRVIATSSHDALYLQTSYDCPKKKISVIPPGVATDIFTPMSEQRAKIYVHADPRQKLLLFVGRIEPLKGIDVLLYALKILLEKKPDLQLCLWIVGNHTPRFKKEMEWLEEVRKLLHITTVVQFVGNKKREDLPYYYNASDIVVLPSNYESFGMTALEALSCGTPVITTDVTGISGMLDKKHEAMITSAGNPLLLARRIKHFLENCTDKPHMTQELRAHVLDFRWENSAEKFIAMLGQIP